MQVRTQSAYTLIELLVVVAILTVVAAIASPAFRGDDTAMLEQVAAEVAGAIRFARSEAIRTGQTHGVYASPDDQRIAIYRVDEETRIFDVHDPFTKRLYDFTFDNGANEVEISEVDFVIDDEQDSGNHVQFSGSSGTPGYDDGGTIQMLQTGRIELGHLSAVRVIEISPMTGRVTVW